MCSQSFARNFTIFNLFFLYLLNKIKKIYLQRILIHFVFYNYFFIKLMLKLFFKKDKKPN